MHLRMPTLAYPQQLRPYWVCASACPQTGQGHHNPFLGKGLTTAFSAGPLLILSTYRRGLLLPSLLRMARRT